MAVVLTLGPLLFSDFEVPEDINFGGEQTLVVQKLVGGDRVIDAMGRDDDDIHWSGRFRGDAAEVRARLGDFLRIQGQPVTLAWSSFRYLVVVRSYKADFKQPFEIPYSITCAVIQDLTTPLLSALLGIDAAISSDVNQALQVGAQIGVPGITSAVAGVASATGAVESFQGASVTTLTGVQGAISLAQAAVAGQTATQNLMVQASGNVAGASSGQPPQTIASNLLNQSSAFGQLGNLYQLQALLGRTSVNVASAGP